MSVFLEKFTKYCRNVHNANVLAPYLQYVLHGDETHLVTAKKNIRSTPWVLDGLTNIWPQLSLREERTVEEQRAMQGAVELGAAYTILFWVRSTQHEPYPEQKAAFQAFLNAFGPTKSARQQVLVASISFLGKLMEQESGQPGPVGEFLLAQSDQDLANAAEKAESTFDTFKFLCRHVPQRVESFARQFLYEGDQRFRHLSPRCCKILLELNSAQYESVVVNALKQESSLRSQIQVIRILAAHFPSKYEQKARELSLRLLRPDAREDISFHDLTDAFHWLVETYQEKILDLLLPHLEAYHWDHGLQENLRTLVELLGPASRPGVRAAAGHFSHLVRLDALGILMAWDHPEDNALIQSTIERGISEGDSGVIVRYVGLAGRWKPDQLEDALWKLFEHKSKPVRQAAARSLARAGDRIAGKGIELLAAKKPAVRAAAVTLLAQLPTPPAIAALERRVDEETDEEIRDQILMVLDQVWKSQGKKITRADINQRKERMAGKLTAPPADWIDEKRLPPLLFSGKKKEALSTEMVRYLLYRQSRAKQIRPDVEAGPLYALIDRTTSGDFAIAFLKMFFASPMAADDRWALTLAALLGDDRLVPSLMQQIRKWVETSRGKMAEYAAQALALLGTDTALCAVDALSIRYRSKQKNIGQAAGQAFSEAAERLGITVDELGDRVVPWLGFEEGEPRLIEQGDKKIEARIGLDFKLEFRDLVKGKKVASLPGSLPAEIKVEFKDLAATLREVVKGQLARLENLMVRQFRWPVERWQELYLVHPLLLPFACRLIWGFYDAHGKLQKTFRALEDRTLTNEQDEPVTLSESGFVGLLHPLELTGELRQAWVTHLADYSIEPPISQLERPVITVGEDEKNQRISSRYSITELNGMTFKNRSERLGWQRGSVVDAGGISSYRKCYPGAGADVVLELENMYIGMGMDESIRLGRFYFIKTGSVAFGSYQYDEPQNDQDERLIPFGEVPPIVFSETMGDLVKISGQKQAEA